MRRVAGSDIKFRERSLTINYDDYGPVYAPVVIFIHGFPFSKKMWEKQVDHLKSNFRVISYDIRNFGASRSHENDYSVDTLTADLISLMDKLQIRKAALCGLSTGGTIALNAVERHPDRFSALILSDTSCRPESYLKSDRLALVRSITKEGIKGFADRSLRKFFASHSFVHRQREILAARQMILSTPVSAICDSLNSLEGKNRICGHLSEISIPVLILVGQEDQVTPPEDARYLQYSIPGAKLNIIELAGHLPNLENSEMFNSYLRQFMEKVSRSRRLSEPLIYHK